MSASAANNVRPLARVVIVYVVVATPTEVLFGFQTPSDVIIARPAVVRVLSVSPSGFVVSDPIVPFLALDDVGTSPA